MVCGVVSFAALPSFLQFSFSFHPKHLILRTTGLPCLTILLFCGLYEWFDETAVDVAYCSCETRSRVGFSPFPVPSPVPSPPTHHSGPSCLFCPFYPTQQVDPTNDQWWMTPRLLAVTLSYGTTKLSLLERALAVLMTHTMG